LRGVVQTDYIMGMKSFVVQIRIGPELDQLIKNAAEETGLSKSEVMRQGLRRGLPQVARALGNQPRKSLIDALREFKGVEVPERRHRMKRRA
jgi:hypothetical protein